LADLWPTTLVEGQGGQSTIDKQAIDRQAIERQEGTIPMKFQHVIAASTIVLVGALGTAGVAGAQTASPQGARKAAACAKATARVPQIQARIQKVEARIALLQTKLTTAQTNHRAEQAKLLQHRIDANNTLLTHLNTSVSEITTRCPA